MSALTSQQLARLYETWADVELTFNAQVIVSSGLVTSEIYFKIGDQHVPCVLYASSMKGARVIAELSDAKVLLTANGLPQGPRKVSLKLTRCELRDDTVLDRSIVRVEDVEGRKDLLALSIQYSSEPPISYKQKISNFFSAHGQV